MALKPSLHNSKLTVRGGTPNGARLDVSVFDEGEYRDGRIRDECYRVLFVKETTENPEDSFRYPTSSLKSEQL